MSSYLPEWYELATILNTAAPYAAAWVGWRAVRAYERRRPARDDGAARRVPVLQRRIRRLEGAIRRLESQCEQALEAQRFTVALLRRPTVEDDGMGARRGAGR